MCWFFKKIKKKSNVKSPILKKYKKCNMCKKVFNTRLNDYLRFKKKNNFIYYCSNNCYVKYVNSGFDLFDITF